MRNHLEITLVGFRADSRVCQINKNTVSGRLLVMCGSFFMALATIASSMDFSTFWLFARDEVERSYWRYKVHIFNVLSGKTLWKSFPIPRRVKMKTRQMICKKIKSRKAHTHLFVKKNNE